MSGLPFDRLPAQGPMAQQVEQEFKAAMETASKDYEIERRTLNDQLLTPEQRNNKEAVLRGKHALKAEQMKREWNQRMTMIQEYEKLGAAGKMAPEQVEQTQYALSGYNMPQQKPDYWGEHQKLLQERERLEQMNDAWVEKTKGRGDWRYVETLHTEGGKKGQPKKLGRKATPEEIRQIEAVKDAILQLDQYEFSIMQLMDPQHRRVNQLSRAMAMGPRVQDTMGVGGKRTSLPLGGSEFAFPGGYMTPAVRAKARPERREPERLETPGYKMTKEKAIKQAQTQLGTNNPKDKERILALAKQIYGAE